MTTSAHVLSARASARRLSGLRRQQRIFAYGTMIPTMIFYAIVWGFSVLMAFYISLHDWNPLTPLENPWIGLRNYLVLFTQDTIVRKATGNTLYLAVFGLLSGLTVAMFIALLMVRSGPKWMQAFRVIYFLPVVTAAVAAALLFTGGIVQERYGILNAILRSLGFAPVKWLTSPYMAKNTLILYGIWKGVGMTIVILLAAMTSIERSFLEAAMIDGANDWQLFWKIILPLMRPALTFLIVTGLIGGLQTFESVYIMTSPGIQTRPGGPMNSTVTWVLHLYFAGFTDMRMGYAAALAVVLFVVTLVLSLIQLRILRQRWEY